MDKDVLYDLYINKELSIRKIGKMLNKGRNTVRHYLRSHNIPMRTFEQSLLAKDEAIRRKNCRNSELSKMLGGKFGRLTVMSRQENNKHGHGMFLCRCECGNEIIVPTYRLTNGNTKSCGCFKSDTQRARLLKHGFSCTRIHRCWDRMIQRCHNPKHKAYFYYGERGISVCDEWRNASIFIEWALANGYSDSLTLDRINNDGNYEPSNCRWVDMKTQAINRRKWGTCKINQ